jgi:hypothetical protein
MDSRRAVYQVLITSVVLLAVTFLFGLWSGLIYRRFGLLGTVVFFAVLTVIPVGAAMIVTSRQDWPAVGDFLTDLNMLAASGLLAIVAAVIAVGGIRHDPQVDGLSRTVPAAAGKYTSGRDP